MEVIYDKNGVKNFLLNEDMWQIIKSFLFTPLKCVCCLSRFNYMMMYREPNFIMKSINWPDSITDELKQKHINTELELYLEQPLPIVNDGVFIMGNILFGTQKNHIHYACEEHYSLNTLSKRQKKEQDLFDLIRKRFTKEFISDNMLMDSIKKCTDGDLLRIFIKGKLGYKLRELGIPPFFKG